MKKIIFIIIVLIALFAIERFIPEFETDERYNVVEDNTLAINKLSFSEDYKYMYADIDQKTDLGGEDLSDSTKVDILTRESYKSCAGIKTVQPKLVKVDNLIDQISDSARLKMLVIADLTLPDDLVALQKKAVSSMSNAYKNNVYMSFMYENRLTAPVMATESTVSQAFVSREESGKYLYSSIVSACNMMLADDEIFPTEKNMALIVMSDGNIYDDDNLPYDPNHFEMQTILSETMSKKTKDSLAIYYVNIDNPEYVDEDQAEPLMKLLTANNNGMYLEQFNWIVLEDDIKRAFHLNYSDYRLTFENPDGKLYTGKKRKLDVVVNSKKTGVSIGGSKSFEVGSPYSPVILNGPSHRLVFIQGLVLVLFLLLLVYIAMQLIYPSIKDKMFRKKYFGIYSGPNTVFGVGLAADTCYFCKDKFKVGDPIVNACQHTMHESCWEENGQHCPEYGNRCSTGSHFYDRRNIFNIYNAPYQMWWILLGLVAAYIAWFLFTELSHRTGAVAVQWLVSAIKDVSFEDVTKTAIYNGQVNYIIGMLKFGTFTSLCFALAYAMKSLRMMKRAKHVFLSVVLRGLISGLGSFLFFYADCAVRVAFNVMEDTFMFDIIPWMLSSYWTVKVSTWHTYVQPNRTHLALAMLIGLLCMNLWGFSDSIGFTDYYVLMLLSVVAYGVALSLCIAHACPVSNHYYLVASGAIKPMEIALYKWFMNNSNHQVSIGRSVDCDIHMAWEYNSDVAPVQATLRHVMHTTILTPHEDGVIVNKKAVSAGDDVNIYHGDTITIGHTVFTYVEKDKKPSR
ncbi:MAG: FHA domain-containing protein [Bacteroidaceae bacterium]|nr:FHA domain-containing protein [Bacteroidaceae bacterium]